MTPDYNRAWKLDESLRAASQESGDRYSDQFTVIRYIFRYASRAAALVAEWNAEVERVPEGYLFLPEYMMRIHGIGIDEEDQGWRLWREAEATTWEDFLLMHMAHRLAFKHGLLLELEAAGKHAFARARARAVRHLRSLCGSSTRQGRGAGAGHQEKLGLLPPAAFLALNVLPPYSKRRRIVPCAASEF
ncbi:hypothetical protein LJK87_19190 [Paenibacillus sp. P25]|nr:hypothetical protein LJK87_19190 [Paenibacillus sp. P25]